MWKTLGNLPEPSGLVTAIVIKDRIYVCGSDMERVYAYSPTGNNFQSFSPSLQCTKKSSKCLLYAQTKSYVLQYKQTSFEISLQYQHFYFKFDGWVGKIWSQVQYVQGRRCIYFVPCYGHVIEILLCSNPEYKVKWDLRKI